jgi:hypothetical protein
MHATLGLRHMCRHIQTYRHTYIQTDRQTDRQTDGHTHTDLVVGLGAHAHRLLVGLDQQVEVLVVLEPGVLGVEACIDTHVHNTNTPVSRAWVLW